MVHRPRLLYHGPDAAALAERWNGPDRAFDVFGADLGELSTATGERFDCAIVESTGGGDASALIERVQESADSVPVIVVNTGAVPAVGSLLPEGSTTQVTVPADCDRLELLEELVPMARELAEQRRRGSMLDSLLSNVPVSVYFKDRDGRHLMVSDAMLDMIGQPFIENAEGKRHHHPDDVVGKSDFDLYADDLAADTVADDVAVMETEEPIENRIEHSWGERGHGTYVATSKAPWYDADGNVRGLVGITRDVSERKRYEYQLERQNERLRRFTTMVSHDIRNPLSVALGRLDVARETGDPEHFDAIEHSLDRIDSLVRNILRVMRQGESVMDPDELSLAEAATRVWEAMDTGDARLRVATSATIFADPGRLHVLLETLFRNSLEHGSECPEADDGADDDDGDDDAAAPLTVTVGDLDDADGFFVADDGVGIPTAQREDIFDPGLSAADSSDIGLSLVAAIADAHNWSITVTESGRASGDDAGDNGDDPDERDAEADDRPGARFEFKGVRLLG